jgi:hypothetical protein
MYIYIVEVRIQAWYIGMSVPQRGTESLCVVNYVTTGNIIVPTRFVTTYTVLYKYTLYCLFLLLLHKENGGAVPIFHSSERYMIR